MVDKQLKKDSLKLLFVDDEENVLKSIKRLMVEEDYEIFTAVSGAEGLDILKANPDIALIVSDHRMPHMTGAEFLEKSREITPDAQRAILTGYLETHAAIEAINKGGVQKYITKPWDANALRLDVRGLVQRFVLLKENKRLTEKVKEQNTKIKGWNDELEDMVIEQTIELTEKNLALDHMNARLKDNFTGIMESFSLLLGLRDRREPLHASAVAEISGRVARSMHLDDKEIETIVTASTLHDIGKIGASDIVLFKKPSEMNAREVVEYEFHPLRGQMAVAKIDDLSDAGKLIRHHHERFDGAGFPDGLKGELIPQGSRIIGLADFIDRAFNAHAGKGAVSMALNDARKLIGKAFDPDIFQYFKEQVADYYGPRSPRGDITEKELSIKDLRSKMVVSRDIISGSGLLILSKGKTLNTDTIKNLRRILELDPSENAIFVWIS